MMKADITWTRKQLLLAYDHEIGEKLAALRNGQKKSQGLIGSALGLSQSDISKIEHGQRSVKAAELIMLAEALDLAPIDLFAMILSSLEQEDAHPSQDLHPSED